MPVPLAYLAVSNAFTLLRLIVRPDTVPRRHRDLLRRRQADAILACDVLETVALSGQQQYAPAVIEHTTRRIHLLGSTARVTQAARNLVMDRQDPGTTARNLTRDRDAKFPAPFDEVLGDAGIAMALTGIRMPRMNAITER